VYKLEIRKEPQLNTKSAISLTLGVLSLFIPFIGAILGIIGIILYKKSSNEIIRTQQQGKGLAISGLVCSIIGISIQLLMILGFVAFLSVGTVIE
jgi:hypothetical protein